jgi:predicted Zn-dependent protease with MMP-like domain
MSNHRPQLSREDFDQVVEQAIARIPEEIRQHLNNMLISVQPRPSADMLADLGMDAHEPLFGLYLGVPLSERSLAEPPLYPDVIHIFQEPLEAYCRTRAELIEEIEITVVHEIAHFVGFSDEDLDALGYG